MIRNMPTIQDVYNLRNKTELIINWEELLDNLLKDIKRNYSIKKCSICGKEFVPCSNNQKYCSRECSEKAKLQLMKQEYNASKVLKLCKTCVICGKEFKTNYTHQKTCSTDCRKEYQRRYQIQYNSKKRGILKDLQRIQVKERYNPLPSGFNQPDKTLGASNLSEHMSNDLDKEEVVIKKELKRFGLI